MQSSSWLNTWVGILASVFYQFLCGCRILFYTPENKLAKLLRRDHGIRQDYCWNVVGDLWRLLETMAVLQQTGTTLKQTTLHGTQPSSVIISRHVKAPTRTLPGTIAQHSAELLLLMNAQELPQPLQEPTLVGCTGNRALNPNRKVVRLRLAGSLPAASGISRRDRPKKKGLVAFGW